MGFLHTTEYHSAVKRNRALMRAAVWMDLENITQSEGSQTQKVTYQTMPFYEMCSRGQSGQEVGLGQGAGEIGGVTVLRVKGFLSKTLTRWRGW